MSLLNTNMNISTDDERTDWDIFIWILMVSFGYIYVELLYYILPVVALADETASGHRRSVGRDSRRRDLVGPGGSRRCAPSSALAIICCCDVGCCTSFGWNPPTIRLHLFYIHQLIFSDERTLIVIT